MAFNEQLDEDFHDLVDDELIVHYTFDELMGHYAFTVDKQYTLYEPEALTFMLGVKVGKEEFYNG